MTSEKEVYQFWKAYLATLPESHIYKRAALPGTWGFGDTPQMANELGSLVREGIKTATCSRYTGGNTLDDAGLSILLDGNGRPLCIVETYEITVRPYRDVDETFAAAEGEGDLSLEFWREAHWNFFFREAEKEGYEASEDMLLSCERFRVLYPASKN